MRGRLRQTLAMFGACIACGIAGATSYRCEEAGRVTYSDLPCASGRQTPLVGGSSQPTAEDRAAAADRQRSDAAALAQLTRERREDERAAALAARRGDDRHDSMRSCAKLATAARRAHDDFDVAGPRQQPKARLRVQRADEDYAALCKRKP